MTLESKSILCENYKIISNLNGSFNAFSAIEEIALQISREILLGI